MLLNMDLDNVGLFGRYRLGRNEQLLLSCFMSLAVQWCQSEAGGGSQGPVRTAGSLRCFISGAEAARPLTEPQPFGLRSAEAAYSVCFTGWSSYTVL